MKRISSKLTPILKYVVPWATITGLSIATLAAFYREQYTLAIVVIIVGIPIVGFLKAMLMDLKTVFLDSARKALIVQGAAEHSIPVEYVIEILRPWTPPYLVTVQLNKRFSFGDSFVFVSNEPPSLWGKGDYGEELKSKISK